MRDKYYLFTDNSIIYHIVISLSSLLLHLEPLLTTCCSPPPPLQARSPQACELGARVGRGGDAHHSRQVVQALQAQDDSCAAFNETPQCSSITSIGLCCGKSLSSGDYTAVLTPSRLLEHQGEVAHNVRAAWWTPQG